MPDLTDRDDDDYYDSLHDDDEAQWFQERVAEQIEEVFDENFKAIFRSKVADWSIERFPQAEASAYRVGTEARTFANNGLSAPAVVWAATCVEIIFRELTLKPIFVGLFLGGGWADEALEVMLRNRWVRDETRAIAKNVLQAIADIDVVALEAGGLRIWDEIPVLLRKRNGIVHLGDEATGTEAARAVDVAAGLYGSLLPTLRELCGLPQREGYRPPEEGAVP